MHQEWFRRHGLTFPPRVGKVARAKAGKALAKTVSPKSPRRGAVHASFALALPVSALRCSSSCCVLGRPWLECCGTLHRARAFRSALMATATWRTFIFLLCHCLCHSGLSDAKSEGPSEAPGLHRFVLFGCGGEGGLQVRAKDPSP